jgi:hypothetical protein
MIKRVGYPHDKGSSGGVNQEGFRVSFGKIKKISSPSYVNSGSSRS